MAKHYIPKDDDPSVQSPEKHKKEIQKHIDVEGEKEHLKTLKEKTSKVGKGKPKENNIEKSF